MTLAELGSRTYNWKGSDNDRDLAYHLAHLHAEVSEAFECLRDALKATTADPELLCDVLQQNWVNKKAHPEGFGIELADVVILASYIANLTGIDLDECVEIKSAYKEDRATRKAFR